MNTDDHIYSQAIEDAALTLDDQIKRFDDIIQNVSSNTNSLIEHWHGEGKTQFTTDYNTIFRQLEDVDDVMYDLYDSLIDASAQYALADEELAKKMSITNPQ